jgi:CRP/FNR family transcriptional regulator, cyclic AMP receptor protein
MLSAFQILDRLSDTDIEWLGKNGTRRLVADGEVIVREGGVIDTLFINLSGQLRVSLRDEQEVARLGAGEVVGEVGFVDSSPASATVTAIGDAAVLALPKALLQAYLKADPAFAARFYRALAIFLAGRLRTTIVQLGYGADSGISRDAGPETDATGAISPRDHRFARLLQAVEVK